MSLALFAATFAAGFVYVILPGPAVLALFALTASDGRRAGARFVTGHLAGDILWGAAALAAIIGVSKIGETVFDALGLACGAFLIWLGLKAIFHRADPSAEPVRVRRPLRMGILFGLTNPKAYPVSVATFTALTASFSGEMSFAQAPAMMASAVLGFLVADAILVWTAGLPFVRGLFARRGALITRLVGVTFVAFGVKSVSDALTGFARRS